MEQGADIHDIGVIVPGLGHRLFKPAVQLGPLLRGAHVLIVLHIVQDDQVGPPVAVLPATDFFTAADGLNLDVALGHQDVGPPHGTGQVPEVRPDRAVLLELHPDIIQEALGLVAAVRNDDGIVLVLIQGRVHGAFERQVGALGVATGRSHHPPYTGKPVDCLGSCRGERGAALQNTLLPDIIQFPVKLRGGAAEVMGEVGPPEELHINGPQFAPESTGAGQGTAQVVFTLQRRPLRRGVLL